MQSIFLPVVSIKDDCLKNMFMNSKYIQIVQR